MAIICNCSIRMQNCYMVSHARIPCAVSNSSLHDTGGRGVNRRSAFIGKVNSIIIMESLGNASLSGEYEISVS